MLSKTIGFQWEQCQTICEISIVIINRCRWDQGVEEIFVEVLITSIYIIQDPTNIYQTNKNLTKGEW